MRRVSIKFIGGILSVVIWLFFVGLWGEVLAEDPLEAVPGDVVINEVMWMGSMDDSSDEWIELRNTTNEEISINGWVIENAAGSHASLEIPAGTVIPANGFFLLANYSEDNSSLALSVSVDWAVTGLSLSNDDNDNLVLRIGVGGTVIDQAQGESGWPVGENSPLKKSMERNDDPGDGLLGGSWHRVMMRTVRMMIATTGRFGIRRMAIIMGRRGQLTACRW